MPYATKTPILTARHNDGYCTVCGRTHIAKGQLIIKHETPTGRWASLDCFNRSKAKVDTHPRFAGF